MVKAGFAWIPEWQWQRDSVGVPPWTEEQSKRLKSAILSNSLSREDHWQFHIKMSRQLKINESQH